MYGIVDQFKDKYYKAAKPVECIIANFRNVEKIDTDFLGGYTVYSGASRQKFNEEGMEPAIGAAYKDALCEPGNWSVYMYMQGETIPRATNTVTLHPTQKDQWGIPLLVTSVGYDDNSERMIRDWLKQANDMLSAAGCKNIEMII